MAAPTQSNDAPPHPEAAPEGQTVRSNGASEPSPFDRALAALKGVMGDEEPEGQPAAAPSEAPAQSPPAEPQQQPTDQGPQTTSEEQERESRRWAELERRDAQARREHQQRVAELEQQKKQLESQQGEWKKQLEALQKLQDDPVTALQQLGHSYEDLTAKFIKGGQPIDLSPVQAEIQKVREEMQAQLQQEREAREKLEHERQTLQARQQIQQTVGTDPDDQPNRWALLRQEPEWDGEVKDVVDAYARQGQQLTYERAADMLETFLRDQYKRRLSDDSIRKILLGESEGGPSQAAAQPSQTPAQPATGSGHSAGSAPSSDATPQTLSNAAASEVSGRAEPKTPEEYRQNVVALLEKSGGLRFQ